MSEYNRSHNQIEKPGFLKNIPLEQCAEEVEFISGKRAIRAPHGKAFSVRGDFTVYYDSSTPIWDPCDSRARYLAEEENRIKFEEWVEEAGGDADVAWGLIENDEFRFFTESFSGKWLCIDVNDHGELCATIREEVSAWGEAGIGLTTSSDDINGRYEAPYQDVEWVQGYVEIDLFTTGVEVSLEDYEERAGSEIELLPDLPRNIILPVADYRASSEEYLRAFGAKPVAAYGDREREALIRQRRESLDPFSDDPLKNFILPRRLRIISLEEARRSEAVDRDRERLSDIAF